MTESFDFSIEGRNFSFPCSFLNSDQFTVRSVPRPYQVTFVHEAPDATLNRLACDVDNTLLFIDANVYSIYKDRIDFPPLRTLVAEATEGFKTLAGVEQLTDFLENHNFTKADRLIVVGGGIIQDVGAFAGCCFKRGIRWTYLPTTLLSMCDSCIGGKTGINYKGAKNQLALFSSPADVVINDGFLNTLNPKDIKSGMGEILKLLVTGGNELLEVYRTRVQNGRVLASSDYPCLIRSALGVKKLVVEEDEFELDLRRSLNYGHTVGHAIEVLSGFQIPHGAAVSMGIVVANSLSVARGMMLPQEAAGIRNLAVDLLGGLSLGGVYVEELECLLRKDKKTLGGKATMILMERAGVTRFVPVEMTADFVRQIADIIASEFG